MSQSPTKKHVESGDKLSGAADITDWADLTNDKITEDFIQRLNYRAHKGNFKDAQGKGG